MRRTATIMLMFIVLAACQSISGDDNEATPIAQRDIYATEGAAIIATTQFDRTQVAMTAAAGETRIAGVRGVNDQLRATMLAVVTPTQPVIPGQQREIDDPMMGMDDMGDTGGTGNPDPQTITATYSATGFAGAVRDSDGCLANPRQTLTTDISRIYAGLRGFDVLVGTPLRIDWYREGELVWTDNWTIDVNDDDMCIWFYITPDDVPFTPGVWSVRWFASGVEVAGPARVTLTAPGGG